MKTKTKELTTEEKLKASGYNMDKGYVPVSKMYVKGWNDAIARTLDLLECQPGGATQSTLENVRSLLDKIV